jgi:hypothetical protein
VKRALAPLFLERRSYRRRRLSDAARVLPLLGIFLLLMPLLWVHAELDSPVGTGETTRYIFAIWSGLILAAWALSAGFARVGGRDINDESGGPGGRPGGNASENSGGDSGADSDAVSGAVSGTEASDSASPGSAAVSSVGPPGDGRRPAAPVATLAGFAEAAEAGAGAAVVVCTAAGPGDAGLAGAADDQTPPRTGAAPASGGAS